MNSNGIVHLTVNHEGRLNLWDTPSAALSGKEPDEVVVQLSLTAPQMRTILRAEQLAREKKRDGQTNRTNRSRTEASPENGDR